MQKKQTFQWIAFFSFLALVLTGGQFWKYRNNLESFKTLYREQKNTEVDKTVSEIDSKLSYFYQSMRTMSLLPGVKKVDRHGTNLDDDAKMSLQQLFNNAYLNIKMSEIYVIPADLDPEKIDPVTKKSEEPIITFDEFRMTLKKDEVEKKPELEEVEEFEYKLMKTQLAFLKEKYPTQASFKDLNVPVISGKPVITCDNADFTKKDLDSGNNEPRNGFVFTVPTYDASGKFHGAISAVLRTRTLKSYLPNLPIGIINPDYGVNEAMNSDSNEWKDSQVYFAEGKENPNLVFSAVKAMAFPDVHPWKVWVAYPEQMFWDTNEAKAIQHTLWYGVAFTWLAAAGAFVFFRKKANLSANIKSVASRLMNGADALASASTQMDSSSRDLKESSVSQNAASSKVASAITEIASMVEKNANYAKTLSEQAEHGKRSSQEGQNSVQAMGESVKQITSTFARVIDQIRKNSDQLTEVMNFMKSVREKTKVIDDIVFQTKLLSFNASVEAARAGESGKGFAVVAEEVGNLAQMSGRSAKEIADMIDQGSARVSEILNESQLSAKTLEQDAQSCLGKGEKASGNCSDAIREIVEQVVRFAQMAEEIRCASQEQEIGVNEISKAIHEIDSLSHKSGEISGSVSEVSENLLVQAKELKTQVLDLGQLIGAKKVDDANESAA